MKKKITVRTEVDGKLAVCHSTSISPDKTIEYLEELKLIPPGHKHHKSYIEDPQYQVLVKTSMADIDRFNSLPKKERYTVQELKNLLDQLISSGLGGHDVWLTGCYGARTDVIEEITVEGDEKVYLHTDMMTG